MTSTRHGKIPDWYSQDSAHYDTFHEDTTEAKTTNITIETILKKHKVKTVLDLTCGTGSQVFWLLKRGYDVTGVDINPDMLAVSQNKASLEKVKVKLLQGDMRTIKVGTFDAAITIFNAVGHITKAGFEKTMRNIHKNLKNGGIYVFDILNLSHVTDGDNIITLSYEHVRTIGDTKLRDIQHSIIDVHGVLTSYTTFYEHKGSEKPKTSKSVGTLQLYTAQELKDMLARNGFEVVEQCGIDGAAFLETTTERIVTVARKR